MIKWRLSDPEDDLMVIENPDTGELEDYIPHTIIHCETKEDFERFKNALDKQNATKPNLWGDGYSDGELVYDMYECPGCGENYELEYDEYKYCPNCGQKLDWSESDETRGNN